MNERYYFDIVCRLLKIEPEEFQSSSRYKELREELDYIDKLIKEAYGEDHGLFSRQVIASIIAGVRSA